MASLIPPLDFSRSTSTFLTAMESRSTPGSVASSIDSTSSTSSLVPAEPSPSTVESAEAQNIVTNTPIQSPSAMSVWRKDLVKCSPTSSGQRNRLVKRTPPPQKSKNLGSGRKESEPKSYRCDIHAASGADFCRVEAESRQLVIGAGGSVIDEFVYPGGFLFQMPPNTPSPLLDGVKIDSGGHVNVAPWTPFPHAVFNGLKLRPYGDAGEFLIMPVPPHRSSMPDARKTWPGLCEDTTRKRVSLWLGELARGYGSNVSYMS